MKITHLYNRIALISPYVEVFLRQLYWRNVALFGSFNPNQAKVLKEESNTSRCSFNDVITWLKQRGIGEGSLLIVHSGYAELMKTGLTPEEIIEKLLELVGPTGTLAMPVIRLYKEAEKAKKAGIAPNDVIYKYNPQKTLVISGLIPYALMKHEGAIISKFPFNPLCAIGPLAKEMMEHNLDGNIPSPHGPNSSWKFCLDHDAKICSIGTDIEHHNTITHVAEEAYGDWRWSDNEWYDKYRFIIEDTDGIIEKNVYNRKGDWGKLHVAEQNMLRRIKKSGSMLSTTINGIKVGYVDPQIMISMFRSINGNGFPYYLLPWQRAKDIK